MPSREEIPLAPVISRHSRCVSSENTVRSGMSLSKIDKSIFEAARDLGANSWQTFLKVTLPLSLPGAISGITMVFIPALTTFAISALLGGSKLLLIGNVIEQEFTVEYDWHLGSALSIILMIFIIINMVITLIFDQSAKDDDE
mgnify:CR=1 FL=1